MARNQSPKRQDGSATFVVNFSGYQNGNWQGELRLINKDETRSFHSLLELIKLMDCARPVSE